MIFKPDSKKISSGSETLVLSVLVLSREKKVKERRLVEKNGTLRVHNHGLTTRNSRQVEIEKLWIKEKYLTESLFDTILKKVHFYIIIGV